VWAVRDRAGVYRAMKIIEIDRLARAGVAYNELDALKAYCQKVERHPYLITVHHIGLSGGCLSYTMELADDLRTRSPVRGRLPDQYQAFTLRGLMDLQDVPFNAAVEIVRRILKGLARLHELDLLHRDVKPSNIVFVNRNPKLADIGIVASGAPGQTPGRSIGTPRYMPPDRAKDKTADVFAAGKILDELIDPRPGAGVRQPSPDVSEWDVERVRAVIGRACAPDGVDRYATASAMLEDLEACRVIAADSLLDRLDWPDPVVRRSTRQQLLQLGFAFVHRIPWIVGLIALIYGLSLLVR
jgi:serine/threonine protein kinase